MWEQGQRLRSGWSVLKLKSKETALLYVPVNFFLGNKFTCHSFMCISEYLAPSSAKGGRICPEKYLPT
jgi:hypothetical protein